MSSILVPIMFWDGSCRNFGQNSLRPAFKIKICPHFFSIPERYGRWEDCLVGTKEYWFEWKKYLEEVRHGRYASKRGLVNASGQNPYFWTQTTITEVENPFKMEILSANQEVYYKL